jgi:hypothetical protein
MNRYPDIAELAQKLNACALEVCRVVFHGKGTVEGGEFKIGDITGKPGQSLRVHLHGYKAGKWSDFNGGEHRGDALELVAQVKFGGNRRRARQWAISWLGLDGRNPARLHEIRYAEAQHEQRCRAEDIQIENTRRAALARYLEAEPSVAGTLVDRYLRGRCIRLDRFPRIPRSLRFHPRLKVTELELRGLVGNACYLPAMVAPIYSLDGKFLSLHRTWLVEDPDGTVRKAKPELSDPKKTYGVYTGGCIRLARGKSGKPLKDAPDDDVILVTEGIENGLTLAQANPDWRVVACVSLPNLAALELPTNVATVIVMQDNDKSTRGLDRGLYHLAGRHKDLQLAQPPAQDKDINDFAQRYARERRAARATPGPVDPSNTPTVESCEGPAPRAPLESGMP